MACWQSAIFGRSVAFKTLPGIVIASRPVRSGVAVRSNRNRADFRSSPGSHNGRRPDKASENSNWNRRPTSALPPLEGVIPFSQEALLVLVPVAIVGIPWLYNHWEIALILSGAVLLSPFGTIISEIFSPRQARRPPGRPDQVSTLLQSVVDVEVLPLDGPVATSSSGASRGGPGFADSATSNRQGFEPMSRQRFREARRDVGMGQAPSHRRVRRRPLQDGISQYEVRMRGREAGMSAHRDDERSYMPPMEYTPQRRKWRLWAAVLSRLPFFRRWGGFL